MTCLSKIKLLVATVVTACAFTLPLASDAWAQAKLNSSQRNCRNVTAMERYVEKIKNFYIPKSQEAALKGKRDALVHDYQCVINNCKQALSLFEDLEDVDGRKLVFFRDKTDTEYSSAFIKALRDIEASKSYSARQQKNAGTLAYNISKCNSAIDSADKAMYSAFKPTDEVKACGDQYPFGCPDGMVCQQTTTSVSTEYADISNRSYTCKKKGSSQAYGSSSTVEGSNVGNVTMSVSGPTAISNVMTKEGESHIQDFSIINGFDGLGEFNETGEYVENVRSNAGFCDISALKNDYMSSCYSCVVVGNLIKTFMSISAITYPVAQEAGVKLLVIGMMIWLAFYVLKKLSSFVSLEPMKMLQELFSFFFKCLIAYVLMTSGLRNITDLIVDPILKAGADYGISIIDSVSKDLLKKTEIVENTKPDDYYQMEEVKDKKQAEKVEKATGNKVVGEIDAKKVRPENMSQFSESKGNYCILNGDKNHAFGAHQLDYRYAGADFAATCKYTPFVNAYNKSGYKQCANKAAKHNHKSKEYKNIIEQCGNNLRSYLQPELKKLCQSNPEKMKQLQEDYTRNNTYPKAFALINKKCGTNLNLSNYNSKENFTLSAALISGYNHRPATMKSIVDNISCSKNSNSMGNQLYDGLNRWYKSIGGSDRYLSEKQNCQTVLAGGDIDMSVLEGSYGSSGSETHDYRQTNHYYVVKKGEQVFDLVPISQEDNQAVLDTTVFDKIMLISRKADNAVSLNFVIGDALVCHSTHAGAIQFAKKVTDLIGLEFYFPDVWIWLCGAVIWVFALMVTLAVNFYLLDLSFKIGFALLALPITIGLWPFEKFKDKFKVCVDIIINAAGTFMFLGITTGLSVVLISTSLGGTEELFSAIENDRKEYISNTFSLAGAKFFLILFAFLYSHKMISETVSKMANKFFPSVTNGLTPMHHMTTQAIDMGVNAAKTVASGVAGAVTGGATTAAKAVAKTAARQAVKGIRKGISKGGSGVKKMLGGK